MCGYGTTSEIGGRDAMTIGAAAIVAGMSRAAIDCYERAGILPRPERCGAGHRRYRGDELGRLRLTRRMRDLGIPSRDIGRLLWGATGKPSD